MAIISETRGAEAKYMIDAAQTDHSVITTLHASGAAMIPSRLISMVAQGSKDFNEVLLGSDITDVIKIGVHMQLDRSDKKMNRFIREVVEYTGYSDKGVSFNYIYRVINDFDDETNTYSTRIETGPVSERFMDKLKLNKLYHMLPVYHHPLCYDSTGRFDEQKAKEIYERSNRGKEFKPDDNVATKTINNIRRR